MDAVMVSDACPSYRTATREAARHHQVINRHRGVSTKYLDNYMRWLQLHDFHPDQTTETNFIVEYIGSDKIHI